MTAGQQRQTATRMRARLRLGKHLIVSDGRNRNYLAFQLGTGQGDQDYPHNVVITFGKDVTFQSFSYTPKKEGENTNGNIKGYKLYASTAENKLDYETGRLGEPIVCRRPRI